MSNFTTFMSATGGGKPARITRYTSGSGTFVPLSYTTSYARITILGGGGAGGGVYSRGGGGAGAQQTFWQWLYQNEAYVVGAAGSRTRFGRMVVEAGDVGGGPAGGRGGRAGISYDFISGFNVGNAMNGISGGQGGNGGVYDGASGSSGNAPNYNGNITGTVLGNGSSLGGGGYYDPDWGNLQGGGGGGDSMYGKGGNGASGDIYSATVSNATAGSGYGAGGGGGSILDYNPPGHADYGSVGGSPAAGSGGLIIIEEFTF